MNKPTHFSALTSLAPSECLCVPVSLSCAFTAAFSYDCSGNLFAVTGTNGVGETYTQTSSLLRVNTTSGVASTVCTFGSLDRVQVGAFINSTVFAHFYGNAPPRMELLVLARQSAGACRGTYVRCMGCRRLFVWLKIDSNATHARIAVGYITGYRLRSTPVVNRTRGRDPV